MNKPDTKTIREAAILSAKLAGCSCTPAVTVREAQPGVFITSVAHDKECSHPSQAKGNQ